MGTARILPHCGLFRQGTEESEQEAERGLYDYGTSISPLMLQVKFTR